MTSLVIFTHVPKTAGSTMRGILAQNFTGADFEFFGDTIQYQEFRQNIPQHVGKYQLIHGHVPYGIHQGLTESPTYFTFLRDPVKRFFSEYFFSFHKESGLHKQVMEGKISLKDFCTTPRPWLDNPYIKFITGHHPGAAQNVDKDALLAQAKERLKRDYLLCGITEYFNESVLILAWELGWNPPIYVKKNVSGANEKGIDALPLMPKAAVEELKDRFRWDYALYAFALDLLREKIYSQPPQFWRALEEMERVTKRLHENYDNDKNRIYTVRHGADKQVTAMYDACPNIKAYLALGAENKAMQPVEAVV